ncbi:UDP-glucuronosyltransferase 1A1-like isoform X1 [Cololabis saira]|uniref:UDP-glucuronosyltransferase 1A1-like isoform X1 n=2 Tax=Cololabis saira TaxID=129043 RepID=UPI002AD5A124|nr:UDP-glucuronosyltransferase 1A1-like isoform X1 [Cololabis saira]
MKRTSVIVILLLNVALEMSGAAGQTGSAADSSEPERTKKAREGNSSPASGSSAGFTGKLLVVPMDGSHWVGLKAIAQELGRRGHEVTVVIPEVSMRMGPGKHFNTVTYPVPYDQAHIDNLIAQNKDVIKKSEDSFLEKVKKKISHIQTVGGFLHTTAESLLFNTSLISHLAQQRFDAVLTDPMVPTGSLIARKLGLPTINLLRGIPCSLDMKAAGCPSPASYVPRFFTQNTDRMNFKERVINTLVALVEPLLCRVVYWHFDEIAHQFLGEKVGIAEVLSHSDIWLLRIDFILEYPRPLMPNVIPVGGINCHVRNPLPDDLTPWVSGPHGFVVFTLGSMVSEFPEERTSTFLEAFKQIPQKVIWRYSGKIPDNMPGNVKMMEWVPQNDLLAHPGVRAFITHAGSHGLFEGLCHAAPMLMMPVAGDQLDNAQKIASRGAGLVLDITTVSAESLLQGLTEVINDARYREKVQELSALHNDRVIDPLDLSVYWTEFVMRHKGAKHLRSAVHDLNWFQYFCLDVIALLAAVVLLVGIVAAKCLKLCLQTLSRKRKQD